ncbi:TPA: hypothetical protein N0F65_008480, partial [Lagenidium giganteum]
WLRLLGSVCTSRIMRISNPHAELPIKNHKYVKSCTELYLANRQIEQLAGFESFVNLEVLWINQNQIARLDGLDTCVRMKHLHAQNNKIRSLESSSIRCFKFLKELHLQSNKLEDLHATLAVLAKLHHLETLDLFANPLAEEENYRLHVVQAIPTLLVFDRHVVTDEERAQAARLRVVSPRDRRRANHKELVAGAPPQEFSGTVKMLFKEVDAYKRELKARERAEAEKEFLDLSKAQQTFGGSTRPLRTLTTGASRVPNLDDWEIAQLKQKFQSLEEKPNSGINRDDLRVLLEYLGGRGFAVSCDGQRIEILAMEANASNQSIETVTTTLFPNDTKVVWRMFAQNLESRRLLCALMPPQELRQRAEAFFEKARQQQRRLQAIPEGDAKREPLLKEIHAFSQKACHLQALAESTTTSNNQQGTRSSAISDRGLSAGGVGTVTTSSTSGPKTRYFITAYSRDAALTSKFHELKEQSAQVTTDVAAKYRLQGKEYTKYLMKQSASTSTKLSKRNVAM